ncbi:radical SAM protein [bacterium]|nr:radical SAM protein [bacterium]
MNTIVKTATTLITGKLTITFDKVVFRYETLSWKRRINWLLAELGYFLKLSKPLALPTHLQIEPSNDCNLACPLCHIVTDNKPRGFMTLTDFKRIIDEIGDYLLFLHFWGWGEPFLNRDFFAMAAYARERGIRIISSTNGHFFQNRDNIDRLIDSGLDVLIVALDGADPETYEQYRQKGDFTRVVDGIKRLLQRRNERGASSPRVNLRMLVTRDNEHQVEPVRALAEELGVDIFSLKTMCSFDNESHWQTILPDNTAYRRFRYDRDGEPIRIKNPCKKPWNHPTVYRDGTVVPCDYYTGEEFNVGNMFSGRGFRDVWFGKRFNTLRRRFPEEYQDGMRCSSCSLNYADVDRCVSHAFLCGHAGPDSSGNEPRAQTPDE